MSICEEVLYKWKDGLSIYGDVLYKWMNGFSMCGGLTVGGCEVLCIWFQHVWRCSLEVDKKEMSSPD